MSPNDSKHRSLAKYEFYLRSQENTEQDYEEDYNTWLEELIYRLRFVNHNILGDSDDSDSDDSDDNTETESQNSGEMEPEDEFVPPPLPEPLLWLNVGEEFELLRNLLPPQIELFFFSNLYALVHGMPLPDIEGTHLPNRNHEVPMARDFYLRGFRFRGQALTAEEADQVVEDFVSFFASRGARFW